ncbi:MAG: DUF3341 domain-containing protein [Armatimonadota bacterium]
MAHHPTVIEPKLRGFTAHYETPEALIEAARRAREAGYSRLDALTPYAVEGLVEALGQRDDRVPKIVLAGGVLGALSGFSLQVYVAAFDYPMNIGGRPNISWPSFIPITFECGVLAAALSALVGMLMLNGLPRPHHPVFDAPEIERVTDDRFVLFIESDDPQFNTSETREFLKATGAVSVQEVIS